MKKLFFGLIGMLFLSCTSIAQTAQERPVSLNGLITVAADLVSANGGCYTVNVRVYLSWEGGYLLVANSNVQIGDCGQQRLATNVNETCKDQEFKGDYFFYTADSFKYCLVDLLQDEEIYAKYVIEKNRVINSVKK